MQKTKAGFVALIGRSNAGKSTLLNALVGSKVAITSPKPQTTRKPVQGILTDERGQIVFVDTPGVFKDAHDHLSKRLLAYVKESLQDVDIVVYVADPTRTIGPEERFALQILDALHQPKILAINKIDIRHATYMEDFRALADHFQNVVEISAKNGTHVGTLKQLIFSYLPESEPFYPAGQLSNMEENEWIAELIREKLFLRLRQEVPYSVHAVVDEIDRRENGVLYIAARVLTSSERYKRIVIGAKARGIKEIGQSVRRELEAVLNTPIYLDLMVDVDPHWVELL
jgi:GTP-binding protein Era